MKTIKDSLEYGLRLGYVQNLMFTDNQQGFEPQIIEYLLTVNITQQLLQCNELTNTQIRLEYNADKFINNAFPAVEEKGDLFSGRETITRGFHKSCRPGDTGRIDIAILKNIEFSPRSFIGIEVKGINPSYAELEEDVERLAQALTETDSTLTNSIKQCYSVFLVYRGGDKRISSSKGLQNRIVSTRKTIDTVVAKVKNKYIFNHNICFSSILKKTKEDYSALIKNKNYTSEITYDEVAKGTGTVQGVIVKLER